MASTKRLFGGVAGLLEAATDHWLSRYRSSRPSAAGDAVSGLTPAVVITGGSAGIGLAIAAEFGRASRPVLLVARNAVHLDAAAASLRAASPDTGTIVTVATLALDVTDHDASAQIDAALLNHGWYCDILVNAAACGLSGPFLDLEPAEIDRLIELNVATLTRLTRTALPPMVARGRGGIINVGSLGGYVPGPNQAAYYASKAYVASLTAALRSETVGNGVRIMELAPGPVETGFHAAMGADTALYRHLLPAISVKRVARAAITGFAFGRSVVVPGVLTKLLAVAVSVLPHAITVPIIAILLRNRPTA